MAKKDFEALAKEIIDDLMTVFQQIEDVHQEYAGDGDLPETWMKPLKMLKGVANKVDMSNVMRSASNTKDENMFETLGGNLNEALNIYKRIAGFMNGQIKQEKVTSIKAKDLFQEVLDIGAALLKVRKKVDKAVE